MTITLIDDAWYQFKKLWTIRILLLAVALNTLAGCLFLFQDWLAPATYIVVNLVLNIAAVIARMFSQPKAHRDAGPTQIDSFF